MRIADSEDQPDRLFVEQGGDRIHLAGRIIVRLRDQNAVAGDQHAILDAAE